MPCIDAPGGVYLLAVQACFDMVILAAIISTNAFIMFSVLRSRRLHTSTVSAAKTSSRFIVNLAAADTWVGLSTLYYLSFQYFCGAWEVLGGRQFTCLLRFVFICTGHMASAYSMAAIAIDRYFAVVHALRYRELMNFRRSTALLTSVWVFSILSSTSIFYWNNWDGVLPCKVEAILPTYFVFLVGMLTHGTILVVVGCTHYRIHREAQAVNQRRCSRESGRAFCSSTDDLGGINTRSARIVLLVTGCYLICWSPYSLIFIVRFAGYDNPTMEVCFQLSLTFANVNYLVNPFIYSWKNAAVKASILRTLRSLGVAKKPRSVSGGGIGAVNRRMMSYVGSVR